MEADGARGTQHRQHRVAQLRVQAELQLAFPEPQMRLGDSALGQREGRCIRLSGVLAALAEVVNPAKKQSVN